MQIRKAQCLKYQFIQKQMLKRNKVILKKDKIKEPANLPAERRFRLAGKIEKLRAKSKDFLLKKSSSKARHLKRQTKRINRYKSNASEKGKVFISIKKTK